MSVRGYVLIKTAVGTAQRVGEQIQALKHPDARVVSVDTVAVPYDVIVQLETDDLDRLGRCITQGIQQIEGVTRTNTCLSVQLG